jgi:NADP-dependent 3-hydroxy acid dehydrogenase YdfG
MESDEGVVRVIDFMPVRGRTPDLVVGCVRSRAQPLRPARTGPAARTALGVNMKDGKRDLVVVIAGGTAGVGRATARRFAKAGSRIAILARGRDGLDATSQELPRLGAAAVAAIACDVSVPTQVFAAAERIERELGPIDIWINNAMTTVFGRFRSLTPEQFERVTQVVYLG